GQLLPDAEREHVLVGARELLQRAEDRPHLALVVQPLVDVHREVGHALARKALERRSVPPLRPPQVAEDVRRGAKKPGKRVAALELDLRPPPPRLEEDNRRQLLGLRPIAGAAEAVVVDGGRVPLEDRSERGRLARSGTLPKSGICRLAHHSFVSALWRR